MWTRRCASHAFAASIAYQYGGGVGQCDFRWQGEGISRQRTLFRKQTEGMLVSNALHCEELELKSLGFKPEYRGQFAPAKPNMEKIPVIPGIYHTYKMPEGTVNGPVFCSGPSVTLQGGPFNSVWLRVHDGPMQSLFSHVADSWLDKHFQQWNKATPGAAFYLSVSETSSSLGAVAQWCQKNGLHFHHHHVHPPEKGPSDYVYCKWHGQSKSLVPPYTTSEEGVGILMLSPDEKEVLLVWEYGCGRWSQA